MSVNLPGTRRNHVVQLISDNPDRLSYSWSRIKHHQHIYQYEQGRIRICRETEPIECTGEFIL